MRNARPPKYHHNSRSNMPEGDVGLVGHEEQAAAAILWLSLAPRRSVWNAAPNQSVPMGFRAWQPARVGPTDVRQRRGQQCTDGRAFRVVFDAHDCRGDVLRRHAELTCLLAHDVPESGDMLF